jgi:dienelactone hydrolase
MSLLSARQVMIIRLFVPLFLGIALAAVSVLPAEAASAWTAPSAKIAGFRNDGRFVRVEEVPGIGDGPKAAVIILHGAKGLGRGNLIYPYARALAERNISSFIVHYFDGLPNVAKQRPASPQLHEARDDVIEAAVTYVEALPGIDPERIGVVGLSLGGFHALSLANRDYRIAAIVNIVGGLPELTRREGVGQMPPTLILHGDRDRVVPVRRAIELARILDRAGSPYELKIFRGEGHAFSGPVLNEAAHKAADFLRHHLKAVEPSL